MEKGLHVKGLYIGTGNETLVQDISLSVGESKCLALIGESGSGKTLTGLAIGGLLPPYVQVKQGEISLNGSRLDSLSEKVLQSFRGKNIAYVFQNYASVFSPHITLDKQLHEALEAHFKLDQKKRELAITKALNEVDLSYDLVKNKYTFQLSGGQLQRVSIAAAIMLKPKLIIADEPTTALDPKNSMQILHLLKQLKEDYGCSIILTTHDLSIARQFADEIAVMNKGRIVETGSTEKLLNHASHPYTQDLLNAEKLLSKGIDGDNKERLDEVDSFKSPIQQTNSPIFLEVRHLQKKYESNIPILNGVSLEIKEGESVGLIGSSGCGKSTFAKCIMQLESYDAGEIYFKTRKVRKSLKEAEMEGNLQAVFQQPGLALNSQLRIIDSLMEPLDVRKRTFAQKRVYHNKREDIAKDLMEQVELSSELLYRYPNQLSGGQKQRISIARAVSTEPKFLILDEPTASLDMIVQAQIIKLLKDLQRKIGYSSLIISHDYNSLKNLTHRIVRLEEGCIYDVEFI